LNEEDEDPNLEGLVSEKLGKPHPHPPKVDVGLVDSAALYLTAILELVLFFLPAIYEMLIAYVIGQSASASPFLPFTYYSF
jgi:hypothetical protein